MESCIANESRPAILTSVPGPSSLLKNGLNQFGLQPLDVGGLGDCFFRAVSHQLYGDPNGHVYIRMSGVEYMKDNPERFIESNTENCWIEYLSNMAKQATWADGLIIQAVADKFHLKIHIVETNPGFAEFNVIQAVNPSCELRLIYLGHVGEYHYVSSVPLVQCPDNLNEKPLTSSVTKRPVQSQNVLPISSVLDPFSLLNNRFNKIGFQPLDVGGLGDCFFRAVSHQLYGDPNGHVYIRMSGVEYMKDNPERFIESNTENCWIEYLSNMAKQGTWADGLIIQAVADKFHLKIHIVETNPGFAEFNVVQAVSPSCEPRLIYLGHVGEYHYVSSVPLVQYPDTLEDQASVSTTGKCKKRKLNDNIRQERNKYMKELMRRKRKVTGQQSLKKNEVKTQRKPEMSLKKYKQKCHEKPEKSTISNGNNDQIIHQLILKFQDVVSKGPVYICTCCDQLWYKHSVSSTVSIRASNPSTTKYLLNTKSEGNVEWLCKTCYNYLKKDKVPPCAAVNGMQFPPKPSFFDLNELECRLLAPRLAFQKLMEAPRGQQLKIHGNIVNVPADVANTVSSLPRLPNETGTIKVNLKRKLQYKSAALSLNIRPAKVQQAAVWFVNNKRLYKEQGITLNQNWSETTNNVSSNEHDEDNSDHSDHRECEVPDTISSGTSSKTQLDEDDWSEDEAENPCGVTDTMLTATNFLEENEPHCVLNVAPAEGNRPLSVFRDKHSEELAYPGIFLGEKRPDNDERLTPVYYSDICKSEVRRSDRRAATCVENLFFKAKKLQMKALLGKSQVALRKCKGNHKSLKAGQLKHQGAFVDRLGKLPS